MKDNNIVCSFCVMDSTVPDIIFDDMGVCQFCKDHKQRIIFEKENYPDYLEKLIEDIKKTSKNQQYDCIIGVSGGVDSTYVAYYLKKILN
ncbi:MAG: ExsB family protein, partial [Candidatus Marinimicrobia bacterium]|nr:ExsB family protein [Candidatus Neomarinimicrobiota bacterium]